MAQPWFDLQLIDFVPEVPVETRSGRCLNGNDFAEGKPLVVQHDSMDRSHSLKRNRSPKRPENHSSMWMICPFNVAIDVANSGIFPSLGLVFDPNVSRENPPGSSKLTIQKDVGSGGFHFELFPDHYFK